MLSIGPHSLPAEIFVRFLDVECPIVALLQRYLRWTPCFPNGFEPQTFHCHAFRREDRDFRSKLKHDYRSTVICVMFVDDNGTFFRRLSDAIFPELVADEGLHFSRWLRLEICHVKLSPPCGFQCFCNPVHRLVLTDTKCVHTHSASLDHTI